MPFLVTPPLPNLTVEIAFDSGFATPEGDRTWTDISDYVEGASSVDITYGRADELSTPDPNTCSLTLDNRDGRFTPAKSSSPYFPNVKKGKPLRVTVTYAGVDYIRFTGYVNEWPLVWPDSTSAAATVSISASSRRARLGQTAPFATSTIRTAYFATGPTAYWPMNDDESVVDQTGRQAFRDVTNPVSFREREFLGAFHSTAGAPVVQDGTLGPTDELSLVRMPAFSDPALRGTFPHYIGGGGVVSVGPAALTVEGLARIVPSGAGDVIANVVNLYTSDLMDQVTVGIYSDATGGAAAGSFLMFDAGRSFVDAQATSGGGPTQYRAATDGEIHHYALTVSGNTVKAYFDGVPLGSLTAAGTFKLKFQTITYGDTTLNATVWVGHGAVHNRALTDAEILDHAVAATTASETTEERVVRVAGRIGVPADEVDVEATVALPLGPQGEYTRTAVEVLDELATSTRSILYDTREGHLALQARNHRYNQSAAFSLSAELQEVQGDLTATTDDRYLVNTVEFSRSGGGDVPSTVIDQDSIDDYGIYSTSLTIVSSSDEETLAAASDLIYRFADGGATPRVNQVSVDVVNLEATQRASVLAADIGTLFNVADLPDQAPSDPMPLYLEGYSESITAVSHILTANTTPGDVYTNVAILDDPAHDVLDSGIALAY